MKTFLTLLSTFILSVGFSQMSIQPVQLSGDTNSCNNSVVIECLNPVVGVYLEEQNPSGLGTPVEIGDTLTDFCYGINMTEGRIGSFTSKGPVSVGINFSSLIAPHYRYQVTDYSAPSSKFAHDGGFTLLFDSVIAPYTFDINSSYAVTMLDDHSLRIDSVSFYAVSVFIQNPLNLQDYAFFSIPVGTLDDMIPETGLDVAVSYHHSNGNCEGWINLQTNNAVGSVYYMWNEQVMSTNNRIDLCPGVYAVYSGEIVNGYPYYYNGKLDTIVLTNDDFTYVDTNLYTIPAQDTSVYTFVECGFNYDAAIDSMHYDEDTLFQAGGMTIVNFTMTLYQGNNVATVSDSLIMINDSLIFLDVVIYCSELKSNDFGGRRIKFLRGVDTHGFEQSPTIGLEEQLLDELILYPNPTSNELHLKMTNSTEEIAFSLLDLQGNILICNKAHQQESSISLDHLAAGNYMLVVEMNGINYRKQFVKQ